MNVKADDRRRIVLPKTVQPGEVFGLSEEGQDRYVLTRIVSHQPKPAKVRIVKSGRYKVGVLDCAVDLEAVQSALDRFP